MCFSGEPGPFAVGQIGTDPLPLRKAVVQLRQALRILPKAGKRDTPCHRSHRQPLGEAVLASYCDRCLCPRLRQTKLTAPKMNNRCEVQRECKAVHVSQLFAEHERSVGVSQSTVGITEEPVAPCRVKPADDPGALCVEQNVGALVSVSLRRVT